MSRLWSGLRSSNKPERLCECPDTWLLSSPRLPRARRSSSEEQPAFFHSYEYLRGHKLGVVRLNPEVSERMSRDGLRETLHPRQLPMLMKPKPWLSYDQGGYLYSQSANAFYSFSCPYLAHPFRFCDTLQGIARTAQLPQICLRTGKSRARIRRLECPRFNSVAG